MKNRNLNSGDNWATPKDLYNKLNQEFHFDFDPCPLFTGEITPENDGLLKDWGSSNFVNPPYSRKLKEAFVKKGIELYINSQTNQVFPVFSEKQYKKLDEKYLFSIWEKIDDTKIVTRFVTSWATKQEDVNDLINDINDL